MKWTVALSDARTVAVDYLGTALQECIEYRRAGFFVRDYRYTAVDLATNTARAEFVRLRRLYELPALRLDPARLR